MKKILITRKLIKDSEDKASKIFEAKFNSNDELYSQSKVIEMSQGCDGILSSLTEKLDKNTIDKLDFDSIFYRNLFISLLVILFYSFFNSVLVFSVSVFRTLCLS